MKNIELLPLTTEAKNRISEFASQYRKFARIIVEIVSFSKNRLIVRVEQKELVNGKQLTKQELEKRVRELFINEIPKDWKLTISAVDFDRGDIDNVSIEWICNKLERFELKAKQLSTYTGIDKSTISLILNGQKELTKWHKLAFYYFFKYLEVSKFKNE